MAIPLITVLVLIKGTGVSEVLARVFLANRFTLQTLEIPGEERIMTIEEVRPSGAYRESVSIFWVNLDFLTAKINLENRTNGLYLL